MAFYIPSGLDRADGFTLLPSQPQGSGQPPITLGTPDPPQITIASNTPGTQTIEEPRPYQSPHTERAEQCTNQHTLEMNYLQAKNFLGFLGRGTFLQDSYGFIWRVLSSAAWPTTGTSGVLQYVCESISFDTPPDEFDIQTSNIGIDLLKHPRYFYALYPSSADSLLEQQVKQSIIRAIQAYRDSAFFPTPGNLAMPTGSVQETIVSMIRSQKINYTIANPSYAAILAATAILGPGATAIAGANPQYLVMAFDNTATPSTSVSLAFAAAAELITKLWYQEDSPYLPGVTISWAQYFFSAPGANVAPAALDLGAYIEDPTLIIPDYFIQGNNPLNIFSSLATLNPQCFSPPPAPFGGGGISWLRQADSIDYQRTWFKLTRTWIGAPIGHWDNMIYQLGPRPSVPSDYGATLY